MTTYYVDTVHGDDTNNGLGPDASAVSNKPWQTIAKALGAAGIASGDTIYLSPSGWFREVVTVAMTSPTTETLVLGDPWNEQGFKSSSGVPVLPGPVVWTAYLTDEKTAPSTSALLNLSGRDHFTIRRILMFGGNVAGGSCILATTASSTDVLLEDCGFMPYHTRGHISITGTFGAALNWTINRCYFGPTSVTSGVTFTGPLGAGADYDLNLNVRNCIFSAAGSSTALLFTTSGTGANKPGGATVNANTFYDCRAVQSGTSWASSRAVVVNDNIIVALGNIGITAGAANSVTESHNVIWSSVGETSGTMTHTGSKSGNNYALVLNVASMERLWDAQARRPWLEPLAPDPNHILDLGNIGASGQFAGADIEGYDRPLTPIPGAFGNRHNTWRRDDASPFADDGSNLYHEDDRGTADFAYVIPVEVGFTYTISIDMQYGTGYNATPFGLPAAELVAQHRIGFAGETKTMTAGTNTPETLTFTPFAPADFTHDFVVLRIIDWNSTGGVGRAHAGNLTVVRV